MTLTEISYYSRKALPFVIIFFLVLLIMFYGIKLLVITFNKPIEDEVQLHTIFNKIDRLDISNSTPSANLNFVLDTIEGEPITSTKSAEVFLLPASVSKFGYSQKIYLMAKAFGFDTEIVKHSLDGKIASFSNNYEELTIDITNFNFNYEYKYNKAPKSETSLLLDTHIPSNNEIISKAVDLLKSVNRYPEELSQGRTNIIYHKYNFVDNKLRTVENPKEANVVEVDFYRPDINGLPVISPKYFTSRNYVIMVFYGKDYRILKAEINFFEKSSDQIGIYPVKTGNQAYEDLKSGKGSIVSGLQGEKDIILKKMFIGYYDPAVYQQYLQPIYVFLGNDDFVAYVPAIEDSWYNN